MTRPFAVGLVAAALPAVVPAAAQQAAPSPPAAPVVAAATPRPDAGRLPRRRAHDRHRAHSMTMRAHRVTVRARAATAKRPARYIVLPQSALRLAAEHRKRAGTPARIGTHRKGAHYKMPARDVKRLLGTVWRAFGYHGKSLDRRVARNYRQIRRESMRRPAVLQGFIGDVNDHRPAGGLLQFVTPTFHAWQVGRRGDRFNPLDNILAAVNAQAHGGNRVLDGRSGWSPKMRHNPLRGRDAIRVIAG
jgi:hypothetical protein